MESHRTHAVGAQPESSGTLLLVWYTHPWGVLFITANVHTSNFLWKQQQLPPSSPACVRALTHFQDSWWPNTNKCRGANCKNPVPSPQHRRDPMVYGTILFPSSLLDQTEARYPLKPHPWSSLFLLPHPPSLTPFNISLANESCLRFSF